MCVGTRKGLLVFEQENDQWTLKKTDFKGIPVSQFFADSVTGDWWAALDHGHWGVKLQRSKDRGETWEEIAAPKYPDGEEIKDGVPATLAYIWAIERVGDKVYFGTDPGGLFSYDDENQFTLNRPLWDLPSRKEWFGGGRDNAGIHSIFVNPEDAKNFYVAISCAGVFETKDGGESWAPKNKGMRADFLPDPTSEIGQDPHLVVASPADFKVLWQQNHCGIYRSADGGGNWDSISEENGPANFGFAVAASETDPDTAWVIPGVSDEVRTAVDGKMCVCRTNDGGKTWTQLRDGLPQENCFDIVYRHCFDIHGKELAFGTTTGNLFYSSDEGDQWQTVSNYLPMVYVLKFVEVD